MELSVRALGLAGRIATKTSCRSRGSVGGRIVAVPAGAGLLAALLTLLSGASAAAHADSSTVVEVAGRRLALPSTAAEPLLVYDRIDAWSGDAERRPRLRLYADGRVLIHQPAYRVDAGDWELQLGAKSVEALLGEVAGCGLHRFDREAAVTQRNEAMAAKASASEPITVVADGTVVRLVTHFAEVDAAGKQVVEPGRAIAWANVQHEAAAYPEIASLQCLARVDRTLRSLLESSAKVRVSVPEIGPPATPDPTRPVPEKGSGHAQ